ALQNVLGREISEPVLLAGGASKEAWAVDAGRERLLVRRAAATVMHHHTLTLEQEFECLSAAYENGVRVPQPYEYIAELAGGEPHPAIELGLWWLRENRPEPVRLVVVNHGDFRIGNVVVDRGGLVGVLDWEFVHLDDPVRDMAFALVRAWRFGVGDKRLGGV